MLANTAAGLIYVWSLFILPLEAALGLDRSDLGAVSSLSLVCYTLGIWALPRFAARLGLRATAGLAFGLIAAGHLCFGVVPKGWMLTAGYGVAFGVGAGLGYGLALTLASRLPDGPRARAIGMVLAAFALSGIVLPLVLGDWIAATSPAFAFRVIGLSTLVPGLACLLLLPRGPAIAEEGDSPVPATPAPDLPFAVLTGVFFCLCFVGLAVVSQVVAMAAARGLAAPSHAATALTFGYLIGSLVGAPAADILRERAMLALLVILCAMGVVAMGEGADILFAAGATLLGLSFGGAGSALPVLVGRRYGARSISAIYGRMILAYGLAGLIAPGLAGALYAAQGSYGPTLVLSLLLAALALGAAVCVPFRPVPGNPTR